MNAPSSEYVVNSQMDRSKVRPAPAFQNFYFLRWLGWYMYPGSTHRKCLPLKWALGLRRTWRAGHWSIIGVNGLLVPKGVWPPLARETHWWPSSSTRCVHEIQGCYKLLICNSHKASSRNTQHSYQRRNTCIGSILNSKHWSVGLP